VISGFRNKPNSSFDQIQVLQVSACRDKIFQYSILESPVRNCFTTLEIDSFDDDLDSLAFALFHVCPRLPNLTSIAFSGHSIHEKLPISQLLSTPPHPDDPVGKRETASKLQELARTIQTWTIKCNTPEQALPYLQANPSQVRNVSLRGVGRKSLIEDSSSPLPAALAQLSSLRHLSFSFAPVRNSRQQVISAAVFAPRYSFRTTLRSLSFRIRSSEDDTRKKNFDVQLLRFAAHFPSLHRLCLKFEIFRTSDEETSSIALPKLAMLSIACYDVDSAKEILRLLNLPLLVRLDLAFAGDYNLAQQSIASTEVDELSERIQTLAPTLRFVNFKHDEGMYESAWIDVVGMLGEDGIVARKSWTTGVAESLLKPQELKPDDDIFEIPQHLALALADMAEWATERARRLGKAGNLEKVQELWNKLDGIVELREWLEG